MKETQNSLCLWRGWKLRKPTRPRGGSHRSYTDCVIYLTWATRSWVTLTGARDEGHPCQIPLYSPLHAAPGQIYLHPGPEFVCVCVWLERGLKVLEYILVLLFRPRDFLGSETSLRNSSWAHSRTYWRQKYWVYSPYLHLSMLFLGKSSKHLDIKTTDAPADAVNEFDNGMMPISTTSDSSSRWPRKFGSVRTRQLKISWPRKSTSRLRR